MAGVYGDRREAPLPFPEQNMTPKTSLAFLTSLAFCLISAPVRAEVTLGSPFTDDMVLQRDKNIAVWGKASAKGHGMPPFL